jgi:hypothetical protein
MTDATTEDQLMFLIQATAESDSEALQQSQALADQLDSLDGIVWLLGDDGLVNFQRSEAIQWCLS